MGSVDTLAKWLQEKPDEGGPTTVMQLRLDRDNMATLAYLADRYLMPKATLASELLKAAIRDTLVATPANDTVTHYDDQNEELVEVEVHNYDKAARYRRNKERADDAEMLAEIEQSQDVSHEGA